MTQNNKMDVSANSISVNQRANLIVTQLLAQADVLKLGVSIHASGCTIVDAGIQHTGCAEAGRLIAEICMGGLGEVILQSDNRFAGFNEAIAVTFEKGCSCLKVAKNA